MTPSTVISIRRFPASDVARLEAQRTSFVFAGNEKLDPHGVTKDQFAAGIYALPDDNRRDAFALIFDCFHVTEKLLDACPNVRWVHHPGAA